MRNAFHSVSHTGGFFYCHPQRHSRIYARAGGERIGARLGGGGGWGSIAHCNLYLCNIEVYLECGVRRNVLRREFCGEVLHT
jgi:hypothetical protein